MFTRIEDDGRRCFIQAICRILQRYARIWDRNDTTTPLAMYRHRSGAVHLITPDLVEKHMRLIAQYVYGLDPVANKAELQLWSCHSLRVGACVLLHSLGFTDTQIQWLLRWRSLAFMAYLRNMALLSDRHAQILDKAAGMPHIF